jgi:glycerol-1-phosphate dehydrogenase [NAD(P)+]
MSKAPSSASKVLENTLRKSQAVHHVAIGADELQQVPELLSRYYDQQEVLIVADENTMAAAGNTLLEVLPPDNFLINTHIFSGTPQVKSAVETASQLLPMLDNRAVLPIAVGSGVINDLVKWAAFQKDRPYLSIATAASMDGYASAGAPLSQDGFKHTIGCRAPRVIVGDLGVLAAAPPEMAAWGYGDLAGKVAAGADWIIADALEVEAIDYSVWPLVQDNLTDWLADPSGVAGGNEFAINHLFNGLVVSSIAMELHQSSRPASGADHQIAHLFEMDNCAVAGIPLSHGTCVTIGTITVLALYEWLLSNDLTQIDVDELCTNRITLAHLEEEIEAAFGASTSAERARREVHAKYADNKTIKKRLLLIKHNWPDIKKRLHDFLAPYRDLEIKLRHAGLVTELTPLGLSSNYVRRSIYRARLIRRRYTILDTLMETALFDQATARLFSSAGRWK